MINPEITEYQLYQLVHEQDRRVGMAEGPERKRDDGLTERDCFRFDIYADHIVGVILTDVFQITDYPDGSYTEMMRLDLSGQKPLGIPKGSRIELVEYVKPGSKPGYEDPSSPVKAFKTGQAQFVRYEESATRKAPILRIIPSGGKVKLLDSLIEQTTKDFSFKGRIQSARNALLDIIGRIRN